MAFTELALRCQGDAQVVVGLGRIGLELDRHAEHAGRFVEGLELAQHGAGVHVRGEVARVDLHRPLQMLGRFVQASPAEERAGEVQPRRHGTRVDLQCLAKMPDRLGQVVLFLEKKPEVVVAASSRGSSSKAWV